MRKSMAKWTSLPLLFLAVLASSCSEDVSGPGDHQAVATRPFHYGFEVTEQILVTVSGVNGDIDVKAFAGMDSIVISGTKRVRSDSPDDALEHLDSVTVDVTNEAGVVSAATEQPEHSGGRIYEVDYDIQIPEDLAVTVSGVNGTVAIRSVARPVVISVVNGTILLDGVSASVTGAVVNGRIQGDVTLPSGGVADLSSVNGEVRLDIPTATSAMFSAEVVNGSISVTRLDLEDMVSTPNSVTGRLGAGQGTIDLSVVNGVIAARGF